MAAGPQLRTSYHDKDEWVPLKASVRGASHARSGKPNEDAIEFSGGGAGVAMAVADGHGSDRCVRSDRGARLAVQAALDVVGPVIEALQSRPTDDLEGWVHEELPRSLVDRWRILVGDDLRRDPLPADGSQLSLRGSDDVATRHVDPLLVPYGTTLLGGIATHEHVVVFQIGDGDIITVEGAGSVRRPLPPDPRLVANETTSLSGREAWRDFRTAVLPAPSIALRLVLFSTDGYANSYPGEQAFFQVVADIARNLYRAGVERVREEMPKWLQLATEGGSGDDISLGILYHGWDE